VSIATITSKGQVTIPKDVRERLGLRAGDRLNFQIDADGKLKLTTVSRRVDQVFGMLSSKARAGRSLSPEEIDAGLRRAFGKRAR
jgi:AbrB family looped-hinge helix DNA binding protein